MAQITSKDQKPKVTILTPVYQEESSIFRFVEEVTRILLTRNEYQFQIIFIDDGSKDRSWAIIKQICGRDARFSGYQLSRNFGSHLALSAGLDVASGDCVCTLACDLQDPPETILEFLEKWAEGADVVWGKRRNRDESFFRIAASNVFSHVIKHHAMPPESLFTTGSFLLIDKKVLNCLKQFRERNRVTFALVAWTGFRQAVVEYDRKCRISGKSSWTFGRMVKSMYDTLVGFSPLPLRLITIIGMTAFICSLALTTYTIFNWMMERVLIGWSSLMASMSLLFSLQFFLTGMMGEYLYRIYSEVVRRPLYLISETVNTEEVSVDKA